jgi:hypothetical protein
MFLFAFVVVAILVVVMFITIFLKDDDVYEQVKLFYNTFTNDHHALDKVRLMSEWDKFIRKGGNKYIVIRSIQFLCTSHKAISYHYGDNCTKYVMERNVLQREYSTFQCYRMDLQE